MYGYEISWQFVDKETMAIACEGGHYASNIEATKTCDLKPGVMYELKCESLKSTEIPKQQIIFSFYSCKIRAKPKKMYEFLHEKSD